MAKNEAKIKFTAETGEFNSAIKKSYNEMSELRAELKLNAAQMADTGNSVDGLKKKHELLEKQSNAVGDRVEALSNKLQSAEKYFGANSDEASKLRVQLANAKTEHEKLKKAVSDCADELDDFKGSSEDVGNGLEKMKGGISNLRNALSTIGGAVGTTVKTMATAVVGAGTALAGSVVAVAESTREYRTAMGKLQVAFDDLGWSSNRAKDTYNDFYALLGDQDTAAEASTLLASLATDQKSLGEWTNISAGVYAKFGDALPIESLIEASNETKETGQLTGALADALNWAGVNEEAFQEKLDKCNSESEREALIRKTLNGIYKDAGEEYKKVNKDVMDSNRAQARLTEAMATFGEKCEPILTAVKNGFARVLEVFGSLVSSIDTSNISSMISSAFSWFIDTAVPAIKDGIQWVINNKETFAGFFSGLGELISAAFSWFIDSALPVIMSGIEWVVANKDTVMALIIGIGAGFAAWNIVQIVTGAITAIKGFATAIQLAGGAFKVLNAVMKANMIGIIITAITALVAAFVYLWNNCDGFREFWINLWNKVKEIATTVWNGLKSLFSTVWNGIKSTATSVWNGIKSFLTSLWNGLKSTASTAWNGVKTAITTVVNGIKTGVTTVWNGIKTATSTAFNAVKSTASSVWNGIKSAVTTVVNGIKTTISNVWDSIKSTTSSAFNGIKSTATSVWNGIKSAITTPIEKAREMVSTAIQKIKSAFNFKWELPKPKIPSFSVSGGKAPWGFMGKGSLPKVSIKWNAEGGIMMHPTIFGMNGSTLLGGGEAGPEAILPIDKLEGYISDVMDRKLGALNLNALADSIEDLANRPIQLNINGRQFAIATAGDGDSVNGLRSTFKSRGLALD